MQDGQSANGNYWCRGPARHNGVLLASERALILEEPDGRGLHPAGTALGRIDHPRPLLTIMFCGPGQAAPTVLGQKPSLAAWRRQARQHVDSRSRPAYLAARHCPVV